VTETSVPLHYCTRWSSM